MILYYFILGTLLAMAGAIPIGSVNIAVIHTSVNENVKKAWHVITAAGIGEVLLATIVLIGSMEISLFLKENNWIHIITAFLFFSVGIYLLLSRNDTKSKTKQKRQKKIFSNSITGFLLAILNPPVLIYWIAVIAMSNTYIVELNSSIPLSLLLLFFSGIYLGKIGTLYAYSIWGQKIIQKTARKGYKTTRIIGSIFVLIAIIQSARLWLL